MYGREQLVRLSGETISNSINVSSGVGQVYPIGATLFQLFLIDLPHYVRDASIHLFADDAKISLPINSTADCNALQNDLWNVSEFFKRNQLNLNVRKTKKISFTKKSRIIDHTYDINNEIIDEVSIINDLGVILNQKMTSDDHIEFIITKAKSRLAWIRRFAYDFEDPWIIKRLFTTFVLPIVEYASQIWSPSTNELT